MQTLGGSRPAAASVAAVGAIVLCLASSGCEIGGGDGARSANDRLADAGGAKMQILGALHEIQANLAAGHGAQVCRDLSSVGRIEVVTSGVGEQATCEQVVETIGARGRPATLERPWKVRSVTIRDGGQATILAAGPDGSPRYVGFVRERRGVWKLATIESLVPGGLDVPTAGPGHDFGDPQDVGPKAAIKEVLYDIQSDFPRGLGSSVCWELSEAGQREIETSGIGSGSCQRRIPSIAKRALAAGFEPRFSRIRSVRIRGGRAGALVREPDGSLRRVPFVKGPHGWKAPSLTVAESIDFDHLRLAAGTR